jgi:flagellar motor switch protein FliM
MLLGGTGRAPFKADREITEIEQTILDGLFRIILHDLKDAWATVTMLDFRIEAHETEPQLLQILAPNEAVVAVSVEIRIGDISGMMNIGIPSIIIKMLRQKFDQQWSSRHSETTEDGRELVLRLIEPSTAWCDARLRGPHLTVADLLKLDTGDVVVFDYAADKEVDLLINGSHKFRGRMASNGRKRCLQIRSEAKID